jgi:hypothetical protein
MNRFRDRFHSVFIIHTLLAIIVLIENNNNFITKYGYAPSLSEVNAESIAILFYIGYVILETLLDN